MIKCPTCEQEMPEDNEFVSMVDYFVAIAIREMFCMMIDKELGIGTTKVRHMLMEHIKDERDAPENIRIWFERNI